MNTLTEQKTDNRLQPYLSPAGGWAFALGTSIGWGSLVVTSNTYLLKAGPMGSMLGMLVGAVIMLVISRNYQYLMNAYPDAGGAYAYTYHAIGYDHGFLTAWFLGLTYLAMFWANATSLPLFARYFVGNIFQFGFRYTIFGYEVYLGEAFLSIAFILLIALLCTRNRRVVAWIMIALVAFFSVVIIICFVGAFTQMGSTGHTLDPQFIPEKNAFTQVLRIACMSPWAFVGFENISHSTEEFSFHHKKSFRILIIAVVTTTMLYVFVTLLSASAYPPEYSNWQEYIKDLGNLEGIKGLPAFYAAYYYMGNTGVLLLILALLALILTSLIGNIVALSRLFYALSKDEILPQSFGRLNKHHVPSRSILFIALISCILPFLGRTAIGWIVDVTTLGAVIIYGYVSASAFKTAGMRGDKPERYTGIIGLAVMIAFGLYLLLPSLFASGSMAAESYFLFVIWALIGFFFFRYIMKKDRTGKFGKTIIVWVALLSLVLFVSLVWMGQTTMSTTENALKEVEQFFVEQTAMLGIDSGSDAFIAQEIQKLQHANLLSMLVVIILFALSLVVLISIYSLMRKRAEANEIELGFVKDMANKDPLTGVKSKHAYVEFERQFNVQLEDGKVRAFSVVVCDVNGLKQVNDTLGHKAGDEYIRSASRLICEMFQHSPVFRIGGDEFVVVLTGHDYDFRQDILTQFNETVESHIKTGDVVISAGIADSNATAGESIHTVFERADKNMYDRKAALKRMGAVTR